MDVSRLSGMEDILIEAITLDITQARITMPNVPDVPGVAAEMFEQIAAGGIVVDMIVQSCGRNGKAAILSVRGTGLRSHTGLAYRMFKTLADGGVNVNVISTSERNIAITVDESNGEKGLQLFQNEFANEMM